MVTEALPARPLGWLDRLVVYLHKRVSAQSLAAFRIAFGLIVAYDVYRFFKYDRIYRYYVEPEFWFTYYGFAWIKPFPEPYIYYAWFAVGVLAVLVAVGLFYRVAIVGFTLLFSYFFLLDKSEYLNHFYMVILFAGLLCLLPANRAYSLDARLFPRRRSATVPRWSVWALRTQMEIILIYAGLVKITEDWLKLEPLGTWLRASADSVYFGELLYYDWVIALGAYGTIVLHLARRAVAAVQRTRLPTFIVYCFFHSANAFFFNIGIFPWLTIAATTIFFEPDWPRRFLNWSSAGSGRCRLTLSPPRPRRRVSWASLRSSACCWRGWCCRCSFRCARCSIRARCGGPGRGIASPGACASTIARRAALSKWSIRRPASGGTWSRPTI